MSGLSSFQKYYEKKAHKYASKQTGGGGEQSTAPGLAIGGPDRICSMHVVKDGKTVYELCFGHAHAHVKDPDAQTMTVLTVEQTACVYPEVYATLRFMKEMFRVKKSLAGSLHEKDPQHGAHAAMKIEFRSSRDICWGGDAKDKAFRMSINKVNHHRDGACYPALAMYATTIGAGADKKYMGKLVFRDCMNNDISAAIAAYIMDEKVCLCAHDMCTYAIALRPTTTDKPNDPNVPVAAPAAMPQPEIHHPSVSDDAQPGEILHGTLDGHPIAVVPPPPASNIEEHTVGDLAGAPTPSTFPPQQSGGQLRTHHALRKSDKW